MKYENLSKANNINYLIDKVDRMLESKLIRLDGFADTDKHGRPLDGNGDHAKYTWSTIELYEKTQFQGLETLIRNALTEYKNQLVKLFDEL